MTSKAKAKPGPGRPPRRRSFRSSALVIGGLLDGQLASASPTLPPAAGYALKKFIHQDGSVISAWLWRPVVRRRVTRNGLMNDYVSDEAAIDAVGRAFAADVGLIDKLRQAAR